MSNSPEWDAFRNRARPDVKWHQAGVVLCLDPGETTGWAIFYEGELWANGQDPTPDPTAMADLIRELVALPSLDRVGRIVYEEYRVRGNKFNEHVGSEVVTIQNIGAIKVIADGLDLPLTKQTAGMAKGFATDDKLRQWYLYQKGLKHSNDAIRHGVYYLLFAYGRTKPNASKA